MHAVICMHGDDFDNTYVNGYVHATYEADRLRVARLA